MSKSFVANGLLGTGHQIGSSTSDTSASAFPSHDAVESTGDAGGTERLDERSFQAAVHVLSTATFVPNGLLGPVNTPKIDENASSSFAHAVTPESQHLQSEYSLIFPIAFEGQDTPVISNGLLSTRTMCLPGEGPSSGYVQFESLFPLREGLPSVPVGSGIDFGPSAAAASPVHPPRSCVRATSFDGKPVYLMKRLRRMTTRKGFSSTPPCRMETLLDVPIHKMMEQLSRATASTSLLRNSDPSPTGDDTLWVDRYRPRKFTELVGNERVARETMSWLKQWDWCVFGRKGKKRLREGADKDAVVDEYHRPREKLLLLSGPPGLGKTTLAHVIARQAGYEVMEINASDARSGQIVDDRIRPALESGSAVGSTKPMLLIIDEIDGATGAGDNSNTFIHKLIQMTLSKPSKKDRGRQWKTITAMRPILRPIICICNDLNAASLAKLRPQALQIRFTKPADIHIVKRLKEICVIEGLKADSRALTMLVGAARGDLRGCLNTLQFMKSRGEEITESIVRQTTMGMKEADTSVLSVLNSLFHPLARKRVKELALGEEEEKRYVARLSQDVGNSGRESNIAIGCFAHYITLHQNDANFGRYEKANEWLVTFDLFSAAMYAEGDFALSAYLPYTIVPFFPLFQERGGQRVERDQTDWEHLQLTQSNEEILRSLCGCLRTTAARRGGDYRHLLTYPILQLEFAPYINRLISPPLRPVNSQFIRPEDRVPLLRLVDIMTCLELRFVQERADDGQLTYRLDPPIDTFVTYDGKRAMDIQVSRYAVRHLVAQEVDGRLSALHAYVVERGKNKTHGGPGFSTRHPDTQPSQHENAPPNKRAKHDDGDIADRPPTDFFGRLIAAPSANSLKAAERRGVEKKCSVTFKYAEGNSAAVRKPVKVGSFL